MSHLTPDEIMDAVDRALAGDRRAHLDECATCRQQVEALRGTLRELSTTDVPEPSPMFWTHFAKRVRAGIAEEPPPSATWLPVWAGWRIATPIAAMTLLVAALVNTVPRGPQPPRVVPATTAERGIPAPLLAEEPLDDASWRLVSELAEQMELDEQSQAGFVGPGAIERATADLNPAERAELLRLLRAELGRPES